MVEMLREGQVLRCGQWHLHDPLSAVGRDRYILCLQGRGSDQRVGLTVSGLNQGQWEAEG